MKLSRQIAVWTTLSGVAVLTILSHAVTAQVESDPGRVDSVTLFRDRALVTRSIEITEGEKIRTMTVSGLPESVISSSVYADGDEGILVRAVRVSPQVNIESNREEVRTLDRRVEELTRQIEDADQKLAGYDKDLTTLESMVTMSTNLANFDLQRGVLDAETLVALTNFSMERRRELGAERRSEEIEREQLNIEREQVVKQRKLAAHGKQTTTYEALVFIELENINSGTLRLRYLVGDCGWSPQYTVRSSTGNEQLEIQYSALVQQMSGESWNNVKLTLSTASPGINAARPGLIPLRVSIANPDELDEYAYDSEDDPFGDGYSRDESEMITRMVESLHDLQQTVEADMDDAPDDVDPQQRDSALNGLAGHMQEIELQAGANSWRTMAPDLNSELSSQVYELTRNISLDSRRENQLVQILNTELAATMYHVATPLLSTFAYREAQVTNSQPVGLLEGPASIYLDDRFVGRMQIPATASGQMMTIGFGADQQVRTRRELMDKVETVKGGNKQLKFVYRLVISNFKDSPVVVRLIDRIPNAQKSQQLSVLFESPDAPLSDDALYVRMEKPIGMLRWDLDVPAERHGSEAFDVQYDFTMEFDRSRVPTMRHALSELQAEYDSRFRSGGGMGGGGLGGGVFNVRD